MPFDNRGKLGVGWGRLKAAVPSHPRVVRLSSNQTADASPAAKKKSKKKVAHEGRPAWKGVPSAEFPVPGFANKIP
jgi:hypothetical protein